MSTIVVIRGEEYVTLKTVAECYELSEAWVYEVFAFGLLGPGEIDNDETLVPVALLDRVATILRLYTVHGFDLDVIAHLLD